MPRKRKPPKPTARPWTTGLEPTIVERITLIAWGSGAPAGKRHALQEYLNEVEPSLKNAGVSPEWLLMAVLKDAMDHPNDPPIVLPP